MTAEAIRTELQAGRPFRLRIADGKIVEVAHSEFAILSPTGRTLIVFNRDDTYEVIDVLLISAVEGSRQQTKS